MIDAVWHQKEYDITIKVIAYLGYKDGQNWWHVENEYGRTGIPESEIKLRGRNYERQ